MTKIIDSGISIDHAKDWTHAEALREVLQNYVDAMREFGCSGTIHYDDGFAIIHDDGPGMVMRHFAFGHTEKMEGSIGQFGEGLKSAFVTILRDNYRIEIYSNNMVVRPFINLSESFDVDTLHYFIENQEEKVNGTKVIVECLEQELLDAKKYFTVFGKNFGLKWLEHEKISQPGGYIYVNGSRVADINDSLYSFHLEGEEVGRAINRDRDAVDMNKIEPLIIETIANTNSVSVMKTVIKDMVKADNHFEGKLQLSAYDEKAEEWKKVWDDLYQSDTVVSNNWETDQAARYRGYTVLNLDWSQERFFKMIGVRTSLDAIREQTHEGVRYELEDLSEEEKKNYDFAMFIAGQFYYSLDHIYVGDLGEGEDGEFDGVTGEITIDRKSLSDRYRALRVLLHELAHRTTKAEDCTERFQKELQKITISAIRSIINDSFKIPSEE